MMQTKTCCKCNIEKNTTDFNNRKSRGKTYIHSWCRICDLAYHAEHKRLTRYNMKENKIELEPKNISTSLQSNKDKTKNINLPKKIIIKKNVSSIIEQPIIEKSINIIDENIISQPIIDESKNSCEIILHKKVIIKKSKEEEIISESKQQKILAQKKYSKEYYDLHKEHDNARSKQYKLDHKDEIKKQRAEYFQIHKNEIREDRKPYLREYYLNNKEKIHQYMKKYRNDNPEVKLRDSLRSSLLDNIYKQKHTEEYLGTPILQVKSWLESNFEEGMTWQNYGTIWQIDHTVAVSLFDCKEDIDKFICFNWKNLYPMFAAENKQKYNTIILDVINNRKERLKEFCIRKNILSEFEEYVHIYDEYIKKFSKTI